MSKTETAGNSRTRKAKNSSIPNLVEREGGETGRPESVDPATLEVLDVARKEHIPVVWDRFEDQAPQCGFGELGICCRICYMGPCRIDPFGEGPTRGSCGADRDTMVARNFARAVASGVSAHADHARGIVQLLREVGSGENDVYSIKGVEKLMRLAGEFSLETGGRSEREIALELAELLLGQFGRQEGEEILLERAPDGNRRRWAEAGVTARGIDREIVELLHRTHVGVDSDYVSILHGAVKAAIADGWGGSMIATDVSDILFGEPLPVRSRVNLGVIEKDMVNIIVHGHEPALSEALVDASKEGALIEKARTAGAKGINLAGMCCTANELLMRQGYPIAGNFLQQELALLTGAVELMAVDFQCIMPAVADVAQCMHSSVITTSEKAKIRGVKHMEFDPARAEETSREIVSMAIENFTRRNPARVRIPSTVMDLVAGFTTENTFHHLGGRFRGSYRPLNDAIAAGRIRGVAGVVGCNTTRVTHDYNHVNLVRSLVEQDVLVVQTGCSAIALAKAGFLRPEAALEHAGRGLREVCEAVGIPPVLHMGSCVDNSRILTTCCEMVREGGIGNDLSELPVAGAAPEAMSEKAIAIALYFVASGIFTVFNPAPGVMGSANVVEYLEKGMIGEFGGGFAFVGDPAEMTSRMVAHLDKKREKLGLAKMMY